MPELPVPAHNAADVAGLIDAGEGVVEVIKAVGSGGIAGHRDELHIGIFLSCQEGRRTDGRRSW